MAIFCQTEDEEEADVRRFEGNAQGVYGYSPKLTIIQMMAAAFNLCHF